MEVKMLKNLEALCKEHLPSILTGTAVIGVFATGISAAKVSPKAKEKVDELDEPTFWDKVKAVSVIYAPTIGIGAATIACIVGSNYESSKRYAALAGAYALSKTQLQEHKNKVLEMFGKEKAESIEQDIAKDQIKKEGKNTQLICASDELVMCKDLVIGKVFRSSMVRIQAAANRVNTLVLLEGNCRLSTFYELLDEDYPDIASDIYWDCESRRPVMDIVFNAEISENGVPYLTFSYERN